MAEFDVEIKMYIDECTRLRHMITQMDEVIKAKDPINNPHTQAEIEGQFQEQQMVIQNFERENKELLGAYEQQANEIGWWKATVEDMQ